MNAALELELAKRQQMALQKLGKKQEAKKLQREIHRLQRKAAQESHEALQAIWESRHE